MIKKGKIIIKMKNIMKNTSTFINHIFKMELINYTFFLHQKCGLCFGVGLIAHKLLGSLYILLLMTLNCCCIAPASTDIHYISYNILRITRYNNPFNRNQMFGENWYYPTVQPFIAVIKRPMMINYHFCTSHNHSL